MSQFGISNRKVLFIIWRCLHIQGHKVFLKCKVQFWFLNGNKSLMKHKKALMHTSPDVQINILTYWTKLWRQLDRHAVVVVVVVVATASSNDDCSLFCGFELLVFYNRTEQNKTKKLFFKVRKMVCKDVHLQGHVQQKSPTEGQFNKLIIFWAKLL